MKKTPFLLIVGDKEMKDETISIRNRKGEDLGESSLGDFVSNLKQEIKEYN